MYKIITVCIFSLFFFIFATHNVKAATYYVATNGNDSNSGSSSAPFRNIQKAADIVNPGDTVVVRDGTYTGDFNTVNIRRGGNSSGWVTFRSENKWGAKVSPNRTRGINFLIQASYISIENFEISKSGTGIQINGDVSNVRIIGNHIFDIGRICEESEPGQPDVARNGMLIKDTSHVWIEGNVIHHIGHLNPGESGCTADKWGGVVNKDHGIYIKNVNDVQVINNILYSHKAGWAVHLHGGPPNSYANRVLIANNTFLGENPHRPGQLILAIYASDVSIINNLFYKPNQRGIHMYDSFTDPNADPPCNNRQGTTNCEEYSNILISNNLTDGGITAGFISRPLTRSDNFVGGVRVSTSNLEQTSAGFVAAPSVSNWPNVNSILSGIKLSQSSAAINRGASHAQVSKDYAGANRPSGAGYDIGAYEYGGTVVTQTATPTQPASTNTATPTKTPTPKPSQSITPTPLPENTQIIQVSEDTYVNGTQPSQNFGSEPFLRVDGDHTIVGDTVNISYLQFDLGNLDKRRVSRAWLELTTHNTSDAGSSDEVQLKTINIANFEEQSLTYQSKPSRSTTFAQLIPSSPSQTYAVDITPHLKNLTTNQLSFALDTNGNDSAIFSSKEGSFPPKLIVELATSSCIGDLNGDSIVDLTDYSILSGQFLSTESNNPADLNSNGRVDLADYSLLVANFFASCL